MQKGRVKTSQKTAGEIQLVDEEIAKNLAEIEREKEEKLLNLIAEIVAKATLKEFYETSD